jgi:DNA-binding MarR family transcriptional regulator
MSKSQEERPLPDQALAELRAFGADVDRLDGAAAVRLGLNRTDLRVMELLNRAGPLPASALATATGLTSAAVTTVIDRLAGRELVVRRYDPADRRRVLVEPTPRAADLSDELFAELLASLRELLAGYSDAELTTILSFVRGSRSVFARHIEALHRRGAAAPLVQSGARPARPGRPAGPHAVAADPRP